MESENKNNNENNSEHKDDNNENKKKIEDEKIIEDNIEIRIIKKDKDENNIDENKTCEKKTEKTENNNLENNVKNIENKQKVIPITKNSSLSPDLFSLSYISDYKCFLCGLIPSPENANEITCCGILFCEECLNKFLEEKKECPVCKTGEIKNRKIKEENKVFYKLLKNLNIKCPYKCVWTGAWNDLDSHLNECKYSFRYCKYKSIGCEFMNDNKTVIEHEKNNDKVHLELAVKYIKNNNIQKKKVKFIIGDKVKVSCHQHEMTYMTSLSWNCDGRKLPHGCYSDDYSFNRDVPRYRCHSCDFDLCEKCIVHYVI